MKNIVCGSIKLANGTTLQGFDHVSRWRYRSKTQRRANVETLLIRFESLRSFSPRDIERHSPSWPTIIMGQSIIISFGLG